jgi:small subunit ribosomal protein S29e
LGKWEVERERERERERMRINQAWMRCVGWCFMGWCCEDKQDWNLRFHRWLPGPEAPGSGFPRLFHGQTAPPGVQSMGLESLWRSHSELSGDRRNELGTGDKNAKMGHQQLYWSHPRKFGQGSRSCRVCSNRHGLIRKYGLNLCRQCFRQYAND